MAAALQGARHHARRRCSLPASALMAQINASQRKSSFAATIEEFSNSLKAVSGSNLSINKQVGASKTNLADSITSIHSIANNNTANNTHGLNSLHGSLSSLAAEGPLPGQPSITERAKSYLRGRNRRASLDSTTLLGQDGSRKMVQHGLFAGHGVSNLLAAAAQAHHGAGTKIPKGTTFSQYKIQKMDKVTEGVALETSGESSSDASPVYCIGRRTSGTDSFEETQEQGSEAAANDPVKSHIMADQLAKTATLERAHQIVGSRINTCNEVTKALMARRRSISSPINLGSLPKDSPPIVRSSSIDSNMYGKLNIGTQWPYDAALRDFVNRDESTKRSPLTSLVLALISNHQSQNKAASASQGDSSPSDFQSVQYLSQRELSQIAKFMQKIESSYQKVPYHNLYHAMDVLAACEVLMNQIEASGLAKFTFFERLTALLAAACHDVGHPGVTSEYIFKHQNGEVSHDVAAQFYHKDDSIGWKGMLERYHSSVALDLMRSSCCELAYDSAFCELFDRIVMATDMTRHASLVQSVNDLANSRETGPSSLKATAEQRQELLRIAIHAADLSNPAKDFGEAKNWAEKVVAEFWLQGDCEKELDGKVISMPLYDREKTSLEGSQMGFIDFCVIPLAKAWSRLLTDVDDAQQYLKCTQSNRNSYAKLKET